jgi:hypothetical protein
LKSIYTILFLLSTSLNVYATEDIKTVDVDNFIKKHQCHDEINNLLKEWGSSKDQWHGILASDGGLIYARPTSMFAVWIEYQQKGNSPRFSKITPGNITNITFNEKCEKLLEIIGSKEIPRTPTNTVDDKKLFAILNKDVTGLIYSWTPHMSLSLAGLKTMQEVAVELKMPLTVLLDSQSGNEIKLAQDRLKQEKIDLPTILVASSMDLYYRRTQIHYPNLLVFKNGRIVDGMLPGLASKKQYIDFINEQVR